MANRAVFSRKFFSCFIFSKDYQNDSKSFSNQTFLPQRCALTLRILFLISKLFQIIFVIVSKKQGAWLIVVKKKSSRFFENRNSDIIKGFLGSVMITNCLLGPNFKKRTSRKEIFRLSYQFLCSGYSNWDFKFLVRLGKFAENIPWKLLFD